jgi:hypothetical protein
MSTTEELIRKFDLQAEVDAFVAAKAARMVEEKQNFSFEGSNRRCGNRAPHSPHYTGSYDTVRYGELGYFCLGVEGEGLHIEIERSTRGSADTPARARGYWWQEAPRCPG